mgnify:CR=1 FL=1
MHIVPCWCTHDACLAVQQTSFVYVFIDLEAAILGGVEFFFTQKLRIISPGDGAGVIRPEFFRDAVKITVAKKALKPPTSSASRTPELITA